MKIVGFTGYHPQAAIQHGFIHYTLSLFAPYSTEMINLHDYEVVPYSEALYAAEGIPEKVIEFASHLKNVNTLVVSVNEQNTTQVSIVKNLYDWMDKMPKIINFRRTPVLLVSTSIESEGATRSLKLAKKELKEAGHKVWKTYSLPNDVSHFNTDEQIVSTVSLRLDLIKKVNYILYNKLKAKDRTRRSCGIERESYEYGDERCY